MAGIKNDAKVQAFDTASAIPDAGYVLKLSSSAGTVDLCGSSDTPIGYSYAGTIDPITGVASADYKVSVVSFQTGDRAEMQVSATNQAISIGDAICCVEGGLVDKRDGTINTGDIIGYALEAVNVNTGGTIDIRVSFTEVQ